MMPSLSTLGWSMEGTFNLTQSVKLNEQQKLLMY